MKKFLEVLLIVVCLALIVALNWAICVAVVYLVALCLGFDVTLLVATGVWIAKTYLQWSFGDFAKLKKKGDA